MADKLEDLLKMQCKVNHIVVRVIQIRQILSWINQ